MIKPLFGAQDDEWVTMLGRYMLNMGGIELATRLIIARITLGDSAPIFSDDLAARIGFVRKRYPRSNKSKHSTAMNTFEVALKHARFRNIVAHSPVVVSGSEDGTLTVVGILSLTPKSKDKVAEVISLEELKARVNESSAVGRAIFDMQSEYPKEGHGG
jgi:hypothetical protein